MRRADERLRGQRHANQNRPHDPGLGRRDQGRGRSVHREDASVGATRWHSDAALVGPVPGRDGPGTIYGMTSTRHPDGVALTRSECLGGVEFRSGSRPSINALILARGVPWPSDEATCATPGALSIRRPRRLDPTTAQSLRRGRSVISIHAPWPTIEPAILQDRLSNPARRAHFRITSANLRNWPSTRPHRLSLAAPMQRHPKPWSDHWLAPPLDEAVTSKIAPASAVADPMVWPDAMPVQPSPQASARLDAGRGSDERPLPSRDRRGLRSHAWGRDRSGRAGPARPGTRR
ncbi:hypothetical protein QO012_002622 [Methylobacterium aerolatum]|uniref:Uncharacterized protein n=1 Tax=Methylobacterium aerolatum TaxID=418708 RepID=A0ABU0I0J2_9HYPH|nr:hypothetical protein [Methylobacterium aerolatum]GJD34017.1 hypothetical protein FMGBMHLM_0913 [Methylobacterium aerolatum]